MSAELDLSAASKLILQNSRASSRNNGEGRRKLMMSNFEKQCMEGGRSTHYQESPFMEICRSVLSREDEAKDIVFVTERSERLRVTSRRSPTSIFKRAKAADTIWSKTKQRIQPI